MYSDISNIERSLGRIADSLEQIANALKHPPHEPKMSMLEFVERLDKEGLPKLRWEDQADGLGEEPEDGKKEEQGRGVHDRST